MTLEEALEWADTFGPLQSTPPDGDAPALMTLAAEVRRLIALHPGLDAELQEVAAQADADIASHMEPAPCQPPSSK